MSFCEVLSCQSRDEPGRIYHRFPSDPSRRKDWIKALGRRKIELKSRSSVCSRHFRTKDYYPETKKLMPTAVPVLRLKLATKEVKPKKIPSQIKKDVTPKSAVSKINNQKKITTPTNPKKEKAFVKSLQSANLKKKLIPEIVNNLAIKNEINGPYKVLEVPMDNEDFNTSKEIGEISTCAPQQATKYHLDNIKTTKKTVQNRNSVNSKNVTPQENPKHTNIPNIQGNGNSKAKQNNSNSNISLVSIKTKISQKIQSPDIDKTFDSGQHNLENIQPIKSIEVESNLLPENKTEILDLQSNSLESQTSKTKKSDDTSLKRQFEELSSTQVKRRRVKRRRLLSCNSDEEHNNDSSNSQPSSSSSRVPKEVSSHCQTSCKGGTKKKGSNITNIEKTILEMQNKIKKLEKKAIVDEKKIETFKKALILQRKNDFKMLLDEKENEGSGPLPNIDPESESHHWLKQLLLRMDLLYLDYDPQRICRLCLLLVDKAESLTSLVYSPESQVLITMIKNTMDIQIEVDDSMPSGICGECLLQIKRVDWVRRRTQRSNMLIKKFIIMKKAMNEDSSSLAAPSPNPPTEKMQFPDDLFEDEVTDTLKIEDVFSLGNSPESLPFDYISIKQEPNDDMAMFPGEAPPLSRSKVNVGEELKCKRCQATFLNCWSLIHHFQYCLKRFQCSECNKCFWNSQLFRRHKQRTQLCKCSESKRSCYECHRVFRWKWQLVFHVYHQHNL